MKAASPALVALLNAAGGLNPLVEADLYTFTLAGGAGALYFGTADFRITAPDASIWNPPSIDGGGMWFDGVAWAPSGIAKEGTSTGGHWSRGLDPDTWECTYLPEAFDIFTGAPFPDKINGVPFLEACQNGALDWADLEVSTAYFAEMPTYPMAPGGAAPVGTIPIFRGRVSRVRADNVSAYIPATDYRALLAQMMPRNPYGASCRHRLFDARCTLSRDDFKAAGAVGSAPYGSIVAAAPIAAPAGSGTYTLGLLTMTSGLAAGQSRVISMWDGAANFALQKPFGAVIVAGDAFEVTAGCDKTTATCAAFANTANFGGFPYIPIPEVALG